VPAGGDSAILKGLSPWRLVEMARSEMSTAKKGVTVKRLRDLAACGDTTARGAIAKAVEVKALTEHGPGNGRWYRPAA
jgi:hypothetical protein